VGQSGLKEKKKKIFAGATKRESTPKRAKRKTIGEKHKGGGDREGEGGG